MRPRVCYFLLILLFIINGCSNQRNPESTVRTFIGALQQNNITTAKQIADIYNKLWLTDPLPIMQNAVNPSMVDHLTYDVTMQEGERSTVNLLVTYKSDATQVTGINLLGQQVTRTIKAGQMMSTTFSLERRNGKWFIIDLDINWP
jgi:hypothetical protein